MLKLRTNCNVCKEIIRQRDAGSERLVRQIFDSRAYRASSDITLVDLQKKWADKFSYDNLLRHTKRHQFINEADFKQGHLRQVAKDAEKAIVKAALTSAQVWDKVMEKGMERLEAGELEINANHLLKAAGDKSTYDIKHAGQQIAVMDMMAHFLSDDAKAAESKRFVENEGGTSGLIEGTDDTEDSSEAFDRRAAQSRSFYQSLAGDAAAPGAD